MNSSDEWPAHEVTLNTFFISRYEVTQHLFEAVMGYNPSYSAYWGDSYLPVEQVPWSDAIRFCNGEPSRLAGLRPCYIIADTGDYVTWDTRANGYRLPTEAEWEYAASGGRDDVGCPYADRADPDAVGWHWGNTSSDGFWEIVKEVGFRTSTDQAMHSLLLCKTFDQIMLVFPDSTDQVVGHADVECAITLTGENLDVVLLHCHTLDSCMRGNDIRHVGAIHA